MTEHGSADLPGTYGPEHVVREQPGVDPHHDGDDHGHGGVGKYLIVFAALIVLTGASFFTYTHYWPFKEDKHVTWAFMMAVSCTKAMLVIMFFMHLLWEANWKWVLTIPAAAVSTRMNASPQAAIQSAGARIDLHRKRSLTGMSVGDEFEAKSQRCPARRESP